MCRVCASGNQCDLKSKHPARPLCSIDHQSDPNANGAAGTPRRAAAAVLLLYATLNPRGGGCLPERRVYRCEPTNLFFSPRPWSCQTCSHRIQRNPLPVRRRRQRWRKRHGREGSDEGTAGGGSTVTATYQRRRRCPSRCKVQPTTTPCSFSSGYSRPAALPGY